MKSYLRFLSRNKLYTAIEVVGLSLAMAFAIPTINWFIQYFDSRYGYEDYRNTWTVTNNYGYIGAAPELGKVIKESIPEIEKISTADMRDKTYELNGYTATAFRCDSMFFEMFPMRFIEGDKSFVNVPTQICISEKFAEHLAEDGKPVLGREVVLGESAYMIAAVMENQGKGAIRYSDILMPLGDTTGQRSSSRQCVAVFTAKDTTGLLEKVRKVCTDFYGLHDPEDEARIQLIRYDKFCTTPVNTVFVQRPLGIGAFISIFSILLITIALMNYSNLSVALTTRRAKEFATNKLVGALTGGIFGRLFAETLIFCTLCFMISVPISGSISELISFTLSEAGYGSADLGVSIGFSAIISYIVLILITTLISALPPALLINHFTPLDIAKGELRYYSKTVTSKIFLCIQMIIAIALVSLSLVAYWEYKILTDPEANCDIDDVFYLVPAETMNFPYEMVLSELEKCPDVIGAGLTFGVPNSCMQSSKKQNDMYIHHQYIICEDKAFELFGFHGVEPYGTENHGLWITDAFQKEMEKFPGYENELLEKFGIENIAGKMETFTSLAGNVKHSKPGVIVTDRSQILDRKSVYAAETGILPGLVIKTGADHSSARKAIAEIYSAATGQVITDIAKFGRFSGYIASDILHHYYGRHSSMAISLGKIALLAIIMLISGLFGISMYFTSEQEKQIAIRKTFGADTTLEVKRMLKSYLRITVIADIITLPFIYLIMKQSSICALAMKELPYAGIIAAGIVISFAICLASVLWQTIRAARTNPAEALKKE